ncbi:MAG TPA: hypothetical protein VGD88_00945 [Opitutaceae bacterium]
MKLFLDTSVLLAAAGSARGASRHVVTRASEFGWELISSDYCREEVRRNLPKLGPSAKRAWTRWIEPHLQIVPAGLSLDRPLVFPKAKDRPIVITALVVRAAWLLTLDERDFHQKLGREVYGLSIATPGDFLIEQRAQGLI